MKTFFQKYLDNNATEEEFRLFLELFTDPSKRFLLEDYLKEDWEQMDRDVNVPELQGSLHKIHFEINKQEKLGPKPPRFLNYLTRAAAILLLPLAIAFLLQLQKNNNRPADMQTISTPLASKTTFQLPDGSTVWLNSGSSISFPDEFIGDYRLVKLKGEAFFDVKKDKKPFRVETSHFAVGVLGTAFNVMAYAGEVPAVTLESGKITLETASKKQAALLPGQQAVIDTVKQSISLNNVEPNLFSSWVRNQLIIKNEPLGAVVNKLERWYNIEIDLTDQSLRDIQMTANIEFESIREVMELMELTLPVKYEYHKNTRKLVVSKK
jgi:ferric-dicitrate binding protein FerR (iron transport regulator)